MLLSPRLALQDHDRSLGDGRVGKRVCFGSEGLHSFCENRLVYIGHIFGIAWKTSSLMRLRVRSFASPSSDAVQSVRREPRDSDRLTQRHPILPLARSKGQRPMAPKPGRCATARRSIHVGRRNSRGRTSQAATYLAQLLGLRCCTVQQGEGGRSSSSKDPDNARAYRVNDARCVRTAA